MAATRRRHSRTAKRSPAPGAGEDGDVGGAPAGSRMRQVSVTDSAAPRPSPKRTVLEATGTLKEQIEEHHREGTVWFAVRTGNESMLLAAVEADPTVLDQRGEVGETPLLMTFVYGHLSIAKRLAKKHPEQLTKTYAGPEYDGENALHIAIVKQDKEAVAWLLEVAPSLLNGLATGRFFTRGEPCGYGEWPILFAVCTNQPNMVDMLVEAGADIEATDSHGLTALHLCVTHGLPEMWSHVRKVWERKRDYNKETGSAANVVQPLWHRVDAQGLSPLMMAAKEGHSQMFEYVLEDFKQVQWTYGPVSCLIIPLVELDLIPGHPMGAIEHIVEHAHLDLLMLPRVAELLDKKWHTFGERLFWRSFYNACLVLMCFMIATVMTPPRAGDQPTCQSMLVDIDAACRGMLFVSAHLPAVAIHVARADWWSTFVASFVSLADAVVLIGCLTKLRIELAEFGREGYAGYFGVSGASFLENMGSFTFCTVGIVSAVLRCTDAAEVFYALQVLQLVQVVAAAVVMCFFLLGFRLTGHFMVMVGEMLVHDIARFLAIVSVFLLGFSAAYMVVAEEYGPSAFLFRIAYFAGAMLGSIDVQEIESTPNPGLTAALLVLSALLLPVLLANMLIAMMGDTYSRLSSHSTRVWRLQRARIQFSLEHQMDEEERNDPANKYWVEIHGERFMELQEVDPFHFRRPSQTGVSG